MNLIHLATQHITTHNCHKCHKKNLEEKIFVHDEIVFSKKIKKNPENKSGKIEILKCQIRVSDREK